MSPPDWKPVPGGWEDKPLVIVGCGTSLKGFDFNLLNDPGLRVLALKQAIFDLPFAEVGFGVDAPWLHKQGFALGQQKVPVTVCYPEGAHPSYPTVNFATYHKRMDHFAGLSETREHIHCGGCTGSVALGYAYLRGAREILLLGYDYKTEGPALSPTGHHYNDSAYPRFSTYNVRMWPRWASWFRGTVEPLKKAGVKVVNGSHFSLVDAFPINDPMTWLAQRKQKVAA